MNSYDVGALVRCSAAFTTLAGVAIDPTVVKFKYRTRDGTATTLTYGTDAALVKDSVGNYHVDVSVTASGDWLYRFESTGTGQTAGENMFLARESEF